MFRKVLIANRGAIALPHPAHAAAHGDRLGRRLLRRRRRRAARGRRRRGGAASAAPPPAESYLDADRILEARTRTGAEAIHPGYGFLSENAEFATRCEAAGIVFIGPTPEQMRDFGLKHTARALAREAGLPLLPGTGLLADAAEALARGRAHRLSGDAQEHGGRRRHRHAALRATPPSSARRFDAVERLAERHFERRGRLPREVRRRAPATSRCRSSATARAGAGARRARLLAAAPQPEGHRGDARAGPRRPQTRAALRRGRRAPGRGGALSLGRHGRVRRTTPRDGAFYFLEVNTRLQVEHGVTEEVTGIDLVEWMVRLAARRAAAVERAPVAARRRDPGAPLRRRSGRATSSPAPAC